MCVIWWRICIYRQNVVWMTVRTRDNELLYTSVLPRFITFGVYIYWALQYLRTVIIVCVTKQSSQQTMPIVIETFNLGQPDWEVFILMVENYCQVPTVYPKNYAHGFVVLCFVVVMQSFIMNSHEVFIHIHQGCFAGTGAIVRLPQCQWSKPDGYGKISQGITTTKHSKAKTVCKFLGIYCIGATTGPTDVLSIVLFSNVKTLLRLSININLCFAI